MHPTVRNVVLFGQRGFQISDLFGNGLYAGFDFTDLERTKVWGPSSLPLLWSAPTQGSAISASAQTVGIALDKSQGVTVGAEMAGNDIGAAPWSAPTGGSVTAGVWSGMSNADYIPLANSLTIGALYRLTWSNVVGGGTFYFGTIYATAAASGSIVFRATGTLFVLYASVAGSITVSSVSLKPITGNHAYQATSGSRPAYTESGALRYLNFDGIDDYLATPLVPGTGGFTIAACFRAATAGSAGNQLVMGAANGGAERCFFGLNTTTGYLAGGYGSQSLGTIVDGGSVPRFDTDMVALLRGNGSTVELWADGTRVYTGASSGSPTATYGISLGSVNSAGTPSGPTNGRIYRAIAVQRFIPDSMVVPLMRALGAGVVSF